MRTATQPSGVADRVTAAVTRALTALALVTAVVVTYLVVLSVHEAGVGGSGDGSSSRPAHPVWKESYSRRFPGCVAVLLWPPQEVPRALVVRNRDGALVQMPVGEATVRVRSAAVGDDVRTVGVCR